MDTDEIYKKFLDWMINFVEVSNSKLNDWPPCPFAKQARLTNKIYFEVIETYNLAQKIDESLYRLEDVEVIAFSFNQHQISADDIQKFVQEKNKELMLKNYVILEDHPDTVEMINGVCMNFKESGLLLLQKLDKLNIASSMLHNKGYYKVWSKENIDEVVSWRHIVE